MTDRTEMFRAWDAAAAKTRALKLARRCEVAERCLKAHERLAAALSGKRPGSRRLALAQYMASRKAVQQ